MVKTILAVIGAGALTGSAPAQTLSEYDQAARNVAIQWLQLIDAHQYSEATSQVSQEVGALRDWPNYFVVQRTPLGRVSKRQFIGLQPSPTFPDVPEVGRYRAIRFKTSFERNPAAIEEVTLAKVGCCWEIFEYKISDK